MFCPGIHRKYYSKKIAYKEDFYVQHTCNGMELMEHIWFQYQ